jgi:hypothetical protein
VYNIIQFTNSIREIINEGNLNIYAVKLSDYIRPFLLVETIDGEYANIYLQEKSDYIRMKCMFQIFPSIRCEKILLKVE